MLGLPKPRGEASASRLGQRSPRPAPLSGKYQSIAGISHCPLSTHLGDEELTFGAQGRRYREGEARIGTEMACEMHLCISVHSASMNDYYANSNTVSTRCNVRLVAMITVYSSLPIQLEIL